MARTEEVIHITTQAQCNELFLFLEKKGITWPDGEKPTQKKIDLNFMYGENTCIFLHNHHMTYGDTTYCENMDRHHISFEEYMEKHENLNIKLIKAIQEML